MPTRSRPSPTSKCSPGSSTRRPFPKFIESMVTGSPRVVAGVAWALSSSRAYPPTMLLDALGTEGIAKSALLDVITAHRARLSVREILAAAYKQEANEKAALFRILGELATDNDLPELVGRLNGKDPVARLHIINILSRFPKPEVQRALQQQLKDTNKLVRAATLGALAKHGRPDRDRAGLRAAARSGNRRAEQGHRRGHPRQRSGNHQVPDPGAQGRERVRAPRRGRSAQRNRQRQVGQGPARSRLRRRLVGAQPRRRCARQDRRPEGRRGRAAAGRRPGRRHPPRRDRDPQPDQGRSRGRPPHRSHQGQGLVGQRTRGRCAGGNRQQARRAAPARNARARRRRDRCRWWCARSAASATTRSSTPCCPCCRAKKRTSASRPSPRSPNSPTSAGSRTSACRSRRRLGDTEQTVAQAALRALSDLDSRFSVQRHAPLVDAESLARRRAAGDRPASPRRRRARRRCRPQHSAAAAPRVAAPPPPPPPAPPHRRRSTRKPQRARSSCPSRTCSAR